MRKRLFDLSFGLFLLLLASPLFLLCALAVKLSSRGPIFYAHSRVGYQGKLFQCWKFRTMVRDAETKLRPLLTANPALRAEWETYFKLRLDPRITPVGKWLRKTSLDELPQLWNVLKGEMSIVGPRPLTEQEVASYLQERASKILSVRPGLTTLWIIQGRNHLSLEKRIELEEYYLAHRSFWFDCKLIVKTALRLFLPTGAY